ncbi:MAG: toxic anion resistance protein [Clostridiales bacterium]|nr:toxic anion resistance protein [Clostridiales bacterium]
MGQDINEMMQEAPVLTLDPFGETKEEVVEVKEEQVEELDVLTPEEKKMVADFAAKIDLKSSNAILQYGAGAQKKIADFSESALENVKTKDLGEVGDMLAGVVTELKSFDEEEEEKGIFGFFKKGGNKLANMKAKYDKAEVNVNKICDALEGHQIQLMKDIAMLDKMYELNTTYFKELSMYIAAGKKKLQDVAATELPELEAKAARSGLPEDAQAVNDLNALCNRFEKKIHDLELTRTISLQMAPQIRLVQSNDTVMSEKIQSTLVNTIPLWKSQMVLAIGVENSSRAAKAQREVTDMTNELLRKNAEKLKLATVETAKESERGIVDIETLKATNESLISTLDEVMKIQQEGKEKRRAAEVELNRIENELKQKLLEIR